MEKATPVEDLQSFFLPILSTRPLLLSDFAAVHYRVRYSGVIKPMSIHLTTAFFYC